MGIQTIRGTLGNRSPETVKGSAGDDWIFPLGGYDFIDGGSGYDRVWVAGNANKFTIINAGSSVLLTDAVSGASPMGATLYNVEEIAFDDKIVKLDSAQIFTDAPGVADVFEGSLGTSTVVYAQQRESYTISKANKQGTLWKVTEPNGLATDTLKGIERLQFKDLSVALDLDPTSVNSAAFDTARVLTTLFSASFFSEPANRVLVGQVLRALEENTHSVASIAQLAVTLQLLPNPSTQTKQFVSTIVSHVLEMPVNQIPGDLVNDLTALIKTEQNPQAPYSADGFIAKAADYVQLTGLASTGLEFVM